MYGYLIKCMKCDVSLYEAHCQMGLLFKSIQTKFQGWPHVSRLFCSRVVCLVFKTSYNSLHYSICMKSALQGKSDSSIYGGVCR